MPIRGDSSEMPVEGRFRRIKSLDALRGLAAIQVIITHIGKQISVPEGYLKITNCLTRYEVALFLIISGALVSVPGKKGFKGFWLPKFQRVFIPYLICTAIITIFYGLSWPDFFRSLISGEAAVPYYFIAILLQCYLLIFFVPDFFRFKYSLPLACALSMSFLFVSSKYSLDSGSFFAGLFFYFCYGSFHSERIASGQALQGKSLFSAVILFLICLLTFTIFPCEFFNYGYFYSIAIFEILLALINQARVGKAATLLSVVGRYGFWIFLIHYAVIRSVFDYFHLEALSYFSALTLLTLPIVAVSMLLAMLASKIYSRLVLSAKHPISV